MGVYTPGCEPPQPATCYADTQSCGRRKEGRPVRLMPSGRSSIARRMWCERRSPPPAIYERRASRPSGQQRPRLFMIPSNLQGIKT